MFCPLSIRVYPLCGASIAGPATPRLGMNKTQGRIIIRPYTANPLRCCRIAFGSGFFGTLT